MTKKENIGFIVLGIAMVLVITLVVVKHMDYERYLENHPEIVTRSDTLLKQFLKDDCESLQNEIKEYDDYILRSIPKELIEAERIVCSD